MDICIQNENGKPVILLKNPAIDAMSKRELHMDFNSFTEKLKTEDRYGNWHRETDESNGSIGVGSVSWKKRRFQHSLVCFTF